MHEDQQGGRGGRGVCMRISREGGREEGVCTHILGVVEDISSGGPSELTNIPLKLTSPSSSNSLQYRNTSTSKLACIIYQCVGIKPESCHHWQEVLGNRVVWAGGIPIPVYKRPADAKTNGKLVTGRLVQEVTCSLTNQFQHKPAHTRRK